MKIRRRKNIVTNRACKATMAHTAILARKFQTTNLAMFNALLMGQFRNELAELIG